MNRLNVSTYVLNITNFTIFGLFPQDRPGCWFNSITIKQTRLMIRTRCPQASHRLRSQSNLLNVSCVLFILVFNYRRCLGLIWRLGDMQFWVGSDFNPAGLDSDLFQTRFSIGLDLKLGWFLRFGLFFIKTTVFISKASEFQ